MMMHHDVMRYVILLLVLSPHLHISYWCAAADYCSVPFSLCPCVHANVEPLLCSPFVLG
jgi:hypothetical protein